MWLIECWLPEQTSLAATGGRKRLVGPIGLGAEALDLERDRDRARHFDHAVDLAGGADIGRGQRVDVASRAGASSSSASRRVLVWQHA